MPERTDDIIVDSKRHLSLLLQRKGDPAVAGASSALWTARQALMPTKKFLELLEQEAAALSQCPISKPVLRSLQRLKDQIPMFLLDLKEVLGGFPQEYFADRAETAVRARNCKIHPQAVRTDVEFGADVNDFMAGYKDSTSSFSIYSEAENLLARGSSHAILVHHWYANELLYVINAWLRNISLAVRSKSAKKLTRAGTFVNWRHELLANPTEIQRAIKRKTKGQHVVPAGSLDFGLRAKGQSKDQGVIVLKANHIGPQAKHQGTDFESAAYVWNKSHLGIVAKGDDGEEAAAEAPPQDIYFFFRDGLSQGVKYCKERRLRRFVLGNGNVTYFCRFENEQLKVSKPLHPDDTQPTLREAFFYHTYQALTESKASVSSTKASNPTEEQEESKGESSTSKPGSSDESMMGEDDDCDDGDDSNGDSEEEGDVEEEDSEGEKEADDDSDWEDAEDEDEDDEEQGVEEEGLLSHKRFGTDLTNLPLKPATKKPLIVSPESQLQFADFRGVIGEGVLGDVYRVKFKGQRLAVKAAAIGSPEETSLRHEASMYEEAASLQGVLLPKVVLSGLAFDGKLFVLGTELLRGPQMNAAVHQHLKQDALDALASLHAVGIVHRDIRSDNILVVQKSIRLLDLHLAESSDEERLRREDVRRMLSLFA